MKKIYYSITTLEPLIITQHSDDPNMYETLQYIRGTVIQGVFAQHYLKNSKTADSEFTRLIVSGDCVFFNAFPVENEKKFFPAPTALVREKYYLEKDEKEENEKKKEKVHNLLVSKIKEQTKGISSLISITESEIIPLLIKKEIRLHNEIDGQTRTAKDGKLFNYQSLPAGMVFEGYISLKKEEDEDVIKKLVNDGENIRMGRSATSEYGKVQFTWINDTANEKPQTTGNIIMTLLSDAIIFNEYGFSSPTVKDMSAYLFNCKIDKSISCKARIEGFLNVWKLRKPSENVFAAGSSFLLDKLPSNAEELTNFGLGERTQEGYGQVSFSLLSSALTEIKYSKNNYKILKPSEMPKLTEEIWYSIYFNRAKEQVINQALVDAENTHPKIESNHLLERLKEIAFSPKEMSDFLENLRSIAKNHLEKAYLDKKNIVEHFHEVLSGETALFKPMKDDNQIDKNQIDKLKTHYFEQYLNQLRRLNIKNEKDEKR